MENKECYSDEISEFEIKLKDKLFELHTKRKLIKELDGKVQKLEIEKHEYQRIVEKTKREMQEISVQMEIAISTARNCESERLANRETMARQKIQYQAAITDRDNLQDLIRSLEIEKVELKRLLKQSDEKLIKQNVMQERCKNKENQLKKSIDQLESEIKKTIENHQKIMEIFSITHKSSQRIVSHLKSKTNLIEKLKEENIKLQEKFLSLNDQISVTKVEKESATPYLLAEKSKEAELKVSLQILENSHHEKDKEISDLQKSLEMAFNSIKFMERKNTSLQNKILILQRDKIICTEAKTAFRQYDDDDDVEIVLSSQEKEAKNHKDEELEIIKVQ